MHIGETGRSMHERIKEHDRDIRLVVLKPPRFRNTLRRPGTFQFETGLSLLIVTRTGTLVELKRPSTENFIDPNSIRRDSRIEIHEVWMSTIRKHSRSITNRTITSIRNNNENRNAPKATNQRATKGTRDQSNLSPDED